MGQARVSKNAHPFDVVIELLSGEGLNDRRNVAQRAVTRFFDEKDFDLELNFQFQRRGVEEDFMRGDRLAEGLAGEFSKLLRAADEPRVGSAGQ